MEHWLVWVTAAGLTGHVAVNVAALGGVAFHYYDTASAAGRSLSVRQFIQHAFPPEVLTSQWTYIDILFYAASKGVDFLLAPVTGGLIVGSAEIVQSLLQHDFGSGPFLPLNGVTILLFFLTALLARDFVLFYLHMMQHRIPVLWEFHKVHHAPQSVIPLTGHRLHPLEEFFNRAGDAPTIGIIAGTFAWLTHSGLDALIVYAIGAQTLVNIVTLSPLRHSHIDLRFGWFERFILSPAHHRLHHSVEVAHWDKNFSAVFPFWDRAWRTFMVPPSKESYRLGLPNADSSQYKSLPSSYVHPFRASLSKIRTLGWRIAFRPGALAGRTDQTPRSVLRWRIKRDALTRQVAAGRNEGVPLGRARGE